MAYAGILPSMLQPSPAMPRPVSLAAYPSRTVMSVLLASVCYLSLLSFINARGIHISPALVGLFEALIFTTCLAVMARHLSLSTVALGLCVATWIMFTWIVRHSPDVKSLRDLIIPLLFLSMGRYVADVGFAERCLKWIIGIAHAGCLDQQRLLGVNLAGAEFNSKVLPGLLFKNYIYPSRQDLLYFKSTGMNLVRLPFRWERLQHEANTPLNAADLAQLQQVVAWGRELDLCILLDMNNYGRYFGQAVGSDAVPVAAFIDVWRRLHEAFDDPASTAFGLMNEPEAIKVPQWLEIAQATVLALRRAGAKNLLMVPSGRWSGAHEWAKTFDGLSAESAFRAFRDPGNNFAIELHQYADANFSGTGRRCIPGAQLRKLMEPVTAWGIREKKRFFLGEFGTDNSPECLATLRAQLEAMEDGQAWLGWSYWAAGPWWGSYPFSIAPKDQPEAAQLTLLREFLPSTPGDHRSRNAKR